MTERTWPAQSLLIQGIEEFNAGAYFECHEALEELWVQVTSPVRELYQGILQVGVALYKVERDQYRGAVKLLRSGVRHLTPFAPVCQGVDVARLIAEANRAREALEALGPNRMGELDRRLFPRVHWAAHAPTLAAQSELREQSTEQEADSAR